MGRLIDADAFYKRYCEVYEYGVDEGEIDRIAYMLSTEPTAYDVEKVVAELEELKDVDVCEFAECVTSECADCVQKNLPNKAIDIVKRGGVE